MFFKPIGCDETINLEQIAYFTTFEDEYEISKYSIIFSDNTYLHISQSVYEQIIDVIKSHYGMIDTNLRGGEK